MENFKRKILNYNNKILKKQLCPLNKNNLKSNIIYKTTITTNNTTKIFIGSTTFKYTYRNHKTSFRNKQNSNKHRIIQLYMGF